MLLVVGPPLYGWCYLADATAWCWFYLAVAVVGIVAVPWAWRRTAERAEQAERLNRSVYMGAVKNGTRLHARPDE